MTSEAESALQSDVLSDNSSEAEESQTTVPQSETENNEPQNQNPNPKKSQYFQTQSQNSLAQQKKDDPLPQQKKQKEGEMTQGKDSTLTGKDNENNDYANAVKTANKRAGQRLVDEPQAKIPDLGDKPDETPKNIEDDSNFGDINYEEQSFDYDGMLLTYFFNFTANLNEFFNF